jgi:hypothetical protein
MPRHLRVRPRNDICQCLLANCPSLVLDDGRFERTVCRLYFAPGRGSLFVGKAHYATQCRREARRFRDRVKPRFGLDQVPVNSFKV